ncbi:MAG: C4-dicarboxylate ABC transporter substrate-binding protein [Nitrospirae bacterium]|nr:C4-dicarboxylate ABC transporter substrate-binding protein [Nitrospirota bacterium]
MSNSSISSRGLLVILALVLFIVIILILIAYHFRPPAALIMTTGSEGGSYAAWGERYRQVLARKGIHITLLPSTGSVENLNRLGDGSFHVDAGFVQDGTTPLSDAHNLVSLGAISYAPLWVFYRSQETFYDVSELGGKRIAIGPEGSGVRKLAIDLLTATNIATPPTMLFDISGVAAGRDLLAGKLDAVMITWTEDNALIKELLYAPDIKLMNFRQAEAYTRIIPALSHVVLPKGILDLSKKMPSEDVHLLAATTNLIVRKDLHPAVVYLLLEAAIEIHSNAGWVNKQGEFPSPKGLSIPSSIYAERFYKSGRPLLLDYLPFGLAAFVDRTLLFLVPAAIILIPIIRSLPWLYSWRHRRKFLRWYRELKNLEMEIVQNSRPEDTPGYREKLDRIEAGIISISVPLAFLDEAYKLQQHVNLIRVKLIRLSHQ